MSNSLTATDLGLYRTISVSQACHKWMEPKPGMKHTSLTERLIYCSVSATSHQESVWGTGKHFPQEPKENASLLTSLCSFCPGTVLTASSPCAPHTVPVPARLDPESLPIRPAHSSRGAGLSMLKFIACR